MVPVINAKIKNDYIIYIEFDNGTNGVIDFKKSWKKTTEK